MAKKKTTNPTNLMAYDFLPNMGAGDNTGLYGQLAQLGRVQRAQPLVDQRITQAFLDPITTYINKAEEQVVAGMVEYNDANPDLDDSLLFDGTEEAIGSQLQENSNRFKELNRKLAYMSPNNKNYADTVSEINKINKENVNLRDQNKKLLDIRNVIKASDISKISTGNGAAYKSMYTDIQQGVKDNFSVKDGKIIWTNPDKNGRVKEISVDSLNAEGPEMTSGAWLELHTKNLNTIGELPANLTASRSALVVKNTFKSLGNSGVKSLLWDNQNGGEKMNSDLTFYNTEPFIQKYIKSASKGVTPDIIEELKVKGMTYTLPGATESIGDAFSKWYQGKLNEEPKFGKGLPSKEENNNRTNYLIDKQSVPIADVQPTVDLLNKNLQNLSPQTSWNGVTWRIVNGQYQFFNTAEEKYQDIDKNELTARGFKLGSQHGVQTGGVMDLNNDGQISKQEFNNFMGGSSSNNLMFPTLQLPKF